MSRRLWRRSSRIARRSRVVLVEDGSHIESKESERRHARAEACQQLQRPEGCAGQGKRTEDSIM